MQTKTKTQNLVTIALMAAFIAAMSQIIIPIGSIPFSLGLFGVLLTAALLRPSQAMASLGVYLVLGIVGVPVFAGFNAGPQALLGPTGGFLAGYFVVALATSLGIKYLRSIPLRFLAGLGGLAGCYALGTLWYMVQGHVGFGAAFIACVAPFVIPDIIKLVAALALGQTVRTRLVKRVH